MKMMKRALAASILAASLSAPALAQEEAEFRLPAQCAADSGMGQMDHGAMHGDNMHGGGMGMMRMDDMDMEGMTDFQRQNMEKMMVTMPAMMDGMMHDNPDVAFACAMIAHHQGAIDMARIQLEHGEDEWIRGLAEEIIEAQVREIDEMTQWLADNAN
jgi:uncharacterized protein (DUF305 family)